MADKHERDAAAHNVYACTYEKLGPGVATLDAYQQQTKQAIKAQSWTQALAPLRTDVQQIYEWRKILHASTVKALLIVSDSLQ